jgi:hypothetical protein
VETLEYSKQRITDTKAVEDWCDRVQLAVSIVIIGFILALGFGSASTFAIGDFIVAHYLWFVFIGVLVSLALKSAQIMMPTRLFLSHKWSDHG